MNFEYFVSKRLSAKSDHKSSVSAPIIKIATVAIALGVIVMLIAFGTGLGLQNKIRDKIAAFNGHVVIQGFSSNESKENLNPIKKNQDFYPDFESIPSVSHIQATATKWGVIRTETDFDGVALKGVDSLYQWNFLKEFLIEGRLPHFEQRASNEILISDYLAKRLKFELGDKVIMYFMRKNTENKLPRPLGLEIVGIYSSGFQDFDKTFVIGDIRQVQRLNQWSENEIGQFEVFTDDFNKIESFSQEIYQNIGSFLNSESIINLYPAIFDWLNLFDFNIIIILWIMILVAGINMITALLVLILERRQMIGVFKALGASNWTIRKIFLYNTLFLILKGLFYGNLIGLSILFLQKYFEIIPLDPSSYYVTSVPIEINLTYILAVNIGTVILCMLMLVVPSLIISKITPVKALKFD